MMKRTSVLFQVVLHLEILAHLLTILQALGTMLIWKLQAFQQDPGYICLCLYIQDQLIYNFFIHTGRIDSFLNGTLFFPCSFTFDPFLSCSLVFFVKKRNKNNKNKTRNRKKRNKITKTKKKTHTLLQGTTLLLQFLISQFQLALQLHWLELEIIIAHTEEQYVWQFIVSSPIVI